jgi:hypothetical protein
MAFKGTVAPKSLLNEQLFSWAIPRCFILSFKVETIYFYESRDWYGVN